MTAPGGLFDDIYKSPTQQRRGGGLFDDIYSVGETEEEKRRREERERQEAEAKRQAEAASRPGPDAPSWLGTQARASVAGIVGGGLRGLSRIAGGLDVITPRPLRSGMAPKFEEMAQQLTERLAPEDQRRRQEFEAGAVGAELTGELLKYYLTGRGTQAIPAVRSALGRVGAMGAGGFGLGALEDIGSRPETSLGAFGAMGARAIGSVNVPGMGPVSLEPAAQQLERLGQTPTGRAFMGAVAGAVPEAAIAGAGRVIGGGRRLAGSGMNVLRRSFGTPQEAAEVTARETPQIADAVRTAELNAERLAQQAATERLMAEQPSPISQAIRQFQEFRAGYGPRALELPVRPDAPAAPSVQEAIDALREPFVGRARAERMLAENAAQVEAGREGYRQTVREAREAQLRTQAEIAAREAQAAQDALNAPTIAQRTALERLRERAPGIGIGLAQAGLGASAGYAAGETPEERAYLASIGAGLAGVPRLGARGADLSKMFDEVSGAIRTQVSATNPWGTYVDDVAFPNLAKASENLPEVVKNVIKEQIDGVVIGEPGPLDNFLLNNKNKEAFRQAMTPVRQALRESFGDEVTLYRGINPDNASISGKPFEYWGPTRALAEGFANRSPNGFVQEQVVNTNDILGAYATMMPNQRRYVEFFLTPESTSRFGARAGVPSIPQEVRSVGRFGFVQLPEAYRAAPNLALEAEHVANVTARTEPILSRVGARTTEAVNGAGLFGGDVSPNSILRFTENAPDEELRTAAAVRGIAFGQDQQLWYRKARPDEPNTSAAFVLTGRDFAELPDNVIDAVVNRLRQADALGPYGGATRDGNHLLALNLKRYTEMDDDQFRQVVTRALDDVAKDYDIAIHPTTYYAEHLDGTADYVRAIGRRPDALRAARDAIVDAEPEYLRYAQATGADVDVARREIADRVKSIDRLLQQVEQPPPLGRTKDTVPVAQAARQVYSLFPRLRATRPEAAVPEMVTRLDSMITQMVDEGVIPKEMAQNFYGGATLTQRDIARLALPELRDDAKYTLYTVVNSILSSGQQVPVETRQGLNVFNQYLRTSTRDANGRLIPGRFSILNPEDVQYKQAVTGGKKGFTGERGGGLLGEAMAASPRTLNHEQALARLDALVQAFGEQGAIEALVEGVPIMAAGGRRVKEERPALIYLFGPKIGQYAMDKLGIPGGGKSTIDLWMARLYYALRGDASGIQGDKLNDTVLPTMRRQMQTVLAEFAKQNNMPESSAQALAWYAIKNAFRNAGAREKRLAYATLGSATTEAMMTPMARELDAEPLAQGLMKGGSYAQAAEGWDDPKLRKFAKATGRKGTIRPTSGAFAGKVFDIGGAAGEAFRTPIGRQILTKGGVYGAGEIVESVGEGGETYDESPLLRETGRAMKGLALITAAYPAMRAGSRVGGAKIRDTLAKTPQGRAVLNSISRDILIDPRIRQVVENTVTEMARYRAIGRELAAEARKLGPAGDRLVSDLVEMENFENVVLDPNEMATAVALANRIADSVDKLGLAKVEQGLISQQTYQARQKDYLRRIYARYAGEEAMDGVPSGAQAQPFRIKGEKQRLDLSPEQRNELGEIREASYRLTETFGRGGKDIATARMFLTLSDIPGVIEPQYKQIFEEAAMARGLRDAALASGDKEAARDASRAYLEAKNTLEQMRQTFKKGDEYVTLPDTPGLGVLRGAVVRRDAAEYLLMVDDWADTKHVWDKALQAWKKIHTVYNLGTHTGNFFSNAIITALAGIPLPMQPLAMRSAYKDLKAYGPATRFLTENGILERGLPLYGVTPVKGLAEDKTALRTLARTTRPETQAALKKQGITPMGAAELAAREAENKVTRAYALEDGVYRVMLFQRYVKDGMEPEAAMKKMMEALPGYDTRSPILKALKNSVSPFVMFPAKYIPAALNLIMEHPERWVAVAAMWGALNEASRRLYEPVEQKDLPPNQRGYNYLIPGRIQVDVIARPAFDLLGIEPPPGDKYTFDVARWTPFSAITGSPAPGAIATQISEDIPGIFQPGGPIADIGALMVNRDPFTGEQVIQPGMTGGEKARAVGGRLASLTLPSVASFQIPRVLKDIERGDAAAAALDAMGILGLRPQVVKPGLQAIREQKKYEDAVSGIQSRLRQELRRNRDPERAQRLKEEATQTILREAEKYRARLFPEMEQ